GSVCRILDATPAANVEDPCRSSCQTVLRSRANAMSMLPAADAATGWDVDIPAGRVSFVATEAAGPSTPSVADPGRAGSSTFLSPSPTFCSSKGLDISRCLSRQCLEPCDLHSSARETISVPLLASFGLRGPWP